jgi:hypothetical protein
LVRTMTEVPSLPKDYKKLIGSYKHVPSFRPEIEVMFVLTG